jgi:hypothetical protein
MRYPWRLRKGKIPPADRSACNEEIQNESAQLLRENKDNPLNLIILSIGGSPEQRDEYLAAAKRHLLHDTQSRKEELVREYFRATDPFFPVTPGARAEIRQEFVRNVILTAGL